MNILFDLYRVSFDYSILLPGFSRKSKYLICIGSNFSLLLSNYFAKQKNGNKYESLTIKISFRWYLKKIKALKLKLIQNCSLLRNILKISTKKLAPKMKIGLKNKG